jgi:ribosomal protein S18 acetylase RimI-like enzyme
MVMRLAMSCCSLYSVNSGQKRMSMSETFTYEIATTAPVEAIVELYQAGGWWQESPKSRAVIPNMIRGSFCFMLARDAGGGIVGMGRVVSDGVSDGYIQDVVVLKHLRGRGIGRELVLRLAQYCAEKELGWIGLVAEPGTYGFYQKLGFSLMEGFQLMLKSSEGK